MSQPILATSDLKGSVTFQAKSYKDLWAVVQFNRPFSTSDLPATVDFIHIHDIPAYVKFLQKADLQASVTWESVSSYEDLDASVLFKQTNDLQASVTWTPGGNKDLQSSVHFLQKFDLESSVNFVYPGKSDLPATVTFGLFSKDLPAYVTFWQVTHTDFPVTITIQPYVQPKGGALSDYVDFLCTIHIQQVGSSDLPASVYFYRDTTKDLPATVTFVQNTHTDFPVTITINNEAQGIEGVTLVANGITYISVPVQTDGTGYFNIINLPPGDYVITPLKSNFAFNPTSIPVKIVDQNITLFFYGDGTLEGEHDNGYSEFPGPPPGWTGCWISQDESQTGTFSVDGYILPSSAVAKAPTLFVVATDEQQASDFRQTLE